MPERQSSSDEATAGPEADAAQRVGAGTGDGAAETATVEQVGNAASAATPPAPTRGGRPVPAGRPVPQETRELPTGQAAGPARQPADREAAPPEPDTSTRPIAAGVDRSPAGHQPPPAPPVPRGAPTVVTPTGNDQPEPAAAQALPKLPTRVPAKPPRTPDARSSGSPSGSALFEPPHRPTPPATDDSPTVRTPMPASGPAARPDVEQQDVPATGRAASDQAAAERGAAERATSDQPTADRVAAERGASDGGSGDRAAADRGAADRAAAERAGAERDAPDRRAAERAAPERSAADRPGAERAPGEWAAAQAADRSAAERSAMSRPQPDLAAAGPAANRPDVADEAPTVAVRSGGQGRTEPETTAVRRSAGPAPAGVDTPTARIEPRRGAAPTAVAPPPDRRPSAADRERTTITPANERPTVLSPLPTGGGPGSPGSPGSGPGGGGDGPRGEPLRRGRRRPLLLVAAVIGVLGLLYVGDLVLGSGKVPRGVTMAGVDVGGLGLADAEQRLRAEIEPRVAQPIPVTVGDASSEIDPAKAGLSVNWPGTVDVLGDQPLNPLTRLTSFFTKRDLDIVSTVDDAALDAALAELAPIMDKPPAEGTVRFEGTTAIAVNPEPGQHLDVPAASAQLRTDWVLPGPIALPLIVDDPVTTPDDVTRAIAEVAEPAVSAPFTVVGEVGTRATVPPEVIAQALSFRGEPGRLVPEINQEVLVEELSPQLADSETPGQDATITVSGGAPIVTPSRDGRGVDYQATLADLVTVLTTPGDREITAVYAQKPADLTTEELNGLGITEVISEFTTGGFAPDSGRNIRRAAEVINGMVVQPGETFSLNEATSPRNAANGYVEAGIIDNGRAGRGIGGGVSQVATTLYNAAYFAGMVDVEHQEHSFYISRYPPGREATVFEGSIDMKFRNDTPTGVLIQTEWTPTSLTVRLYGTKRYDVTSTPGPRTNPTSPNTVTIPAGEQCAASNGAPGFTITDTRTLRDITTGEVRTENRTVRYNPIPIVICEG